MRTTRSDNSKSRARHCIGQHTRTDDSNYNEIWTRSEYNKQKRCEQQDIMNRASKTQIEIQLQRLRTKERHGCAKWETLNGNQNIVRFVIIRLQHDLSLLLLLFASSMGWRQGRRAYGSSRSKWIWIVMRKKINVNAPVAARARLVEEAGRIRRSEGVRL